MFLQIVVWLGVDSTCSVEGIAFDSFCDSEAQARQAASAVLSVFTIAFACSCTLGGILFDYSGWTGMTVCHVSLQGLMFLFLACEPACRHSFIAVLSEMEPEELETGAERAEGAETDGNPPVLHVIPAPEVTDVTTQLPGVVEEETTDAKFQGENSRWKRHFVEPSEPNGKSFRLAVEDATDELRNGLWMHGNQSSVMTRGTGVKAKTLQTSNTKETGLQTLRTGGLRLMRASPLSRRSRFSVTTGNTNGSKATDEAVQGRLRRAQAKSFRSRLSATATRASSWTAHSASTSKFSLSQMTGLSETGKRFQHHFASRAVLPQIVGARGRDSVQREELHVVDESGSVVPAEIEHIGAGVPTDAWLPAACVALNSFCLCLYPCVCNLCHLQYFKRVHNRADASLAGMTQMAGDVCGGLRLQLVPFLFSRPSDPDNLGCCGRFCHCLLSKPYTLSMTLFTWIHGSFSTSPW